jgi:hypothetical protein
MKYSKLRSVAFWANADDEIENIIPSGIRKFLAAGQILTALSYNFIFILILHHMLARSCSSIPLKSEDRYQT